MTATTYIQGSTGEKGGVAVYGVHIYGNLYGCDEELLSNEVFLLQLVRDAADVANATVISAFYHKFGSSGGVSAVAIVAESHISIHTCRSMVMRPLMYTRAVSTPSPWLHLSSL